uniref:Uncharacterized protein n=1 Tax=Timema bartmani TaxID=61472 RepID=A0A7R9HY46_9NEOP|nr:unnamed protein product [Timema bartmani]
MDTNKRDYCHFIVRQAGCSSRHMIPERVDRPQQDLPHMVHHLRSQTRYTQDTQPYGSLAALLEPGTASYYLFSTPDRDSYPDLPLIDSIFKHERDALSHVVTEAGAWFSADRTTCSCAGPEHDEMLLLACCWLNSINYVITSPLVQWLQTQKFMVHSPVISNFLCSNGSDTGQLSLLRTDEELLG